MLPALQLISEQISDYTPEIVIVFNKLSESDYLDLVRSEQPLEEALCKFFSFCKQKTAETEATKTTSNQASKSEGIGPGVAQKDLIAHCLIPLDEGADYNKMTPCYQVAKEEFVNKILALQKKPFLRPISEKEWLRNSSKIWESIKRSSLISDYNRTWQKMQVFKS